MTAIFVDTVFWIALRMPRDPYHQASVRWQRHLTAHPARLLTTGMVFWEVLNALSHPTTRAAAAAGYERARRAPSLEIVPADSAYTEEAFRLYASRADKGWSLTDCLSFVVAGHRGITVALTSDHHFEQAGIEPLLLRDPPDA